MIDCVYIYKPIKINIQKVIKNLEMLKAASNYLKTKQVHNCIIMHLKNYLS